MYACVHVLVACEPQRTWGSKRNKSVFAQARSVGMCMAQPANVHCEAAPHSIPPSYQFSSLAKQGGPTLLCVWRLTVVP